MGTSPEPTRGTEARRGTRRGEGGKLSRRKAPGKRSFKSSLAALDALAASGAQVSVRVTDLDSGEAVLVGDDYVTLPVAGLGVVPLLVEVAAQFESGELDPLELVEREGLEPVDIAGIWQHLKAPTLALVDLAVLAAASGDALATNALLHRVGLPTVRARIEKLGLTRAAVMDGFRDRRGPDDAPHVALGSAREYSELFAALVNSKAVSAGVSAQVSEWLSLNQDLSLVASATGLDPFAHFNDAHELLFVNKTGRDSGVRAEAGVLGGPRAGVAYAVIVCFDDLSISHRLRAHEALRTLGVELMEYVF
ncbi:beta-lactamase class A [Microbacterium halimionae]|uniref:Beta-lactamase class A n=1 Tax=Microbacterium halimionae TaxID=1526413 RepID=A0A7W3JLE9_9MICO|nr:serine hydrolase [Microbacterium halimionae]MBA8815015.1 beta-lactamase class A [Microbacterium halimionae]NII94194.1 beta-lactamase class A [Microbacterium halimionae]